MFLFCFAAFRRAADAFTQHSVGCVKKYQLKSDANVINMSVDKALTLAQTIVVIQMTQSKISCPNLHLRKVWR